MQALKDAIDLDLDVVAECSSFYVREMLAHMGSSTADARFKAQVARLAPKLAAYMATIVGGEVRYYGNGSDALDCGCHCEECHWDGASTTYHDKECGCREQQRHGTCDDHCSNRHGWGYRDTHRTTRGPCGYAQPGERAYPEGNVILTDDMAEYIGENGHNSGNGRKDAWRSWHAWQANGGDIVAMLDEAYRMFKDADMWADSYGGEGWATIARLTRDYYSGKVKPATFVDRVWSVEHNGGNAFDKGYGDAAYGLANVLRVQYENNYDALTAHVDHETRAMWNTRNARTARHFDGFTVEAWHDGRDPAWLGTQATYEEVW